MEFPGGIELYHSYGVVRATTMMMMMTTTI
jgi:hypothetical protein